jgi:hypothetical protein
VNQRRSAGKALFQIDHRGKLLELDIDIVERILRDIAALGDYDHQRFADMTDFALGQRNLGALVEDDAFDRRGRDQQRAGLPVIAEVAGNIGGHHAGTLQRPCNVNLQDSGMCDLAAQKCSVQHARKLDVVDEQSLPGEKPAVLIAFDRLAEGAGGHRASAPHPYRGRQHGIDDVLVSGATAQIA